MRRIACATILIAVFAALLPVREAEAKYCPRVLYRATRLVVVTVPNMQATGASVRTFERKSPAAPWETRSDPEPAVVGGNGIAWSDIYESLAKKGEPLKREGDQRAPAGIYRISATSGAEPSKLPGYLPLVPTKQLCVADTNSRYEGKTVPQSFAGENTNGENMAKFSPYRRGLVIDAAPRLKAQGGACIFLDVRGHFDAGTDARIALPKEWVDYLQEWAAHRFAAIAIVSEDTVDRYKGCLPPSDTATDNGVSVPLPVRKSAAKQAS